MGISGLEKGHTLLSRFSLIQALGEGGMGQVWLVRDLELKVDIVIKVLNPQLAASPARVELLKNECRNARRLVHPNIVRIFDFHRSHELAFISMEYVDGEDLDVYRRRQGILTYDNVITRLLPVIAALSYAHGMGLVHRDLKAGNVLMDRKGAPRVADFGIAGVLHADGEALTITSGGSLYCMSPQQLDGQRPHPSDDIYALGTLMYELLTGYPPFYPHITPEKIHRGVPPTVNEKLEQMSAGIRIPDSLNAVISKLIAKVPDERPASLEEIHDTLQKVLDVNSFQTIPPAVAVHTSTKAPFSNGRGEVITPAKLSESEEGFYGSRPRRPHLLKTLSLIFALVVLLAGGGLLLHYLSRNPVHVASVPDESVAPEPKTENMTVKVPKGDVAPGPVETADPVQLTLEKDGAEEKMTDFLRAKKELDGRGGAEWGGDLYAKMIQLSQEADALFMNKEYASASNKYAEALWTVKELAGQSHEALRRVLEEGRLALAEGDGKRAVFKFNVALMIDPRNEFAHRSLERAKRIETVMRLIESGMRHEQKDNLSFALTDYQEALRLDPRSREARIASNRVKGMIADDQFQQLMSSGLTALHNEDYEVARAAFLKAKSFKPNSNEVQDALAQVDQGIRLARIEILREKALAAEKTEDWDRALEAYVAALEIDSAIQFANRGKERSLERIRIAEHIDFYLGKPDVLESDRHLENAALLLQEASKIEPKGPRLTVQIAKLDRLVKIAQTPVRITLVSDNLTEVAVYKVGRLGRFHTRDLNLRPGTYTVVGTRNGYKDVRHQMVVKAGEKSVRLAVKCEEGI
jgi:serine/threonine protein kinase/tetratricopeptide (TPR) repeat protein